MLACDWFDLEQGAGEGLLRMVVLTDAFAAHITAV